MKNTLYIFLLFIFPTAIMHAQDRFEVETKNKDKDYIFIKGKDTIFGTIILISRTQTQQISCIKYLDENKQEHQIGEVANIGGKAKANVLICQKVLSLRAAGYKLDFFPDAMGNPDHCEVLTSGNITMWGQMELSLRLNKQGERVIYEKYPPQGKFMQIGSGKPEQGIDCDKAKNLFSQCSGLTLPRKINYDNVLFYTMKYNNAGCK